MADNSPPLLGRDGGPVGMGWLPGGMFVAIGGYCLLLVSYSYRMIRALIRAVIVMVYRQPSGRAEAPPKRGHLPEIVLAVTGFLIAFDVPLWVTFQFAKLADRSWLQKMYEVDPMATGPIVAPSRLGLYRIVSVDVRPSGVNLRVEFGGTITYHGEDAPWTVRHERSHKW
jgi:hypothetical protein